jgi:hypothetical protein
MLFIDHMIVRAESKVAVLLIEKIFNKSSNSIDDHITGGQGNLPDLHLQMRSGNS